MRIIPLSALVIAIQIQVIAAAYWDAAETILIIARFGMKAVAFVYACSCAALLPHLIEAGQQTPLFTEPANNTLKFIPEAIGQQARLMREPSCPEFLPAAAKVTPKMPDTAAFGFSFLAVGIQPACLSRIYGMPG